MADQNPNRLDEQWEARLSAARRSGFISAVGALHNAMPDGFVELDSDKIISRVAARVKTLESENARLKAVVEACVAWQEKFDCYFCALGSPPHAEDCPLVVGGFIEQSGERVK